MHSQDETTSLRDFDRGILRSTFVSIFWAVLTFKRKTSGYRLQHLADALNIDKSTVSRWFSSVRPNWRTNTISDIAGALNVEIRIEVVDRTTGRRFNAQGEVHPVQTGSDGTSAIVTTTIGPKTESRAPSKAGEFLISEQAA